MAYKSDTNQIKHDVTCHNRLSLLKSIQNASPLRIYTLDLQFPVILGFASRKEVEGEDGL